MSATYKQDYHFFGRGTIPLASDAGAHPFVRTVTGSGPPTAAYTEVSGVNGAIALALEATSEAQNICVSNGDILCFPIDNLAYVEFVARISTALTATATTMWAFGLAGARNDAIASLAQRLLFRGLGNGSAAVIVDSDDGTTDVTAAATGETLATTWKRFGFDFTGVNGKSGIQVFMDGARGFKRVAQASTFNMGAYSGNLQFYAQVQKAANTNVGTLQLDRFSVTFRE